MKSKAIKIILFTFASIFWLYFPLPALSLQNLAWCLIVGLVILYSSIQKVIWDSEVFLSKKIDEAERSIGSDIVEQVEQMEDRLNRVVVGEEERVERLSDELSALSGSLRDSLSELEDRLRSLNESQY